MATLSQDQIDQLLAGLDTRQMPSGQFIWTDKNGNSYAVERDDKGNLSFPNGGQPIDSKTVTSKQNIKTFADGKTHIVTNNPDGTVSVGDVIAQKPAKVLEGKIEKFGDGFHVVTYDENGKPQIDPQVVSALPGKTLSPGQKLRNAPDGLHSVNNDGTLGPLVSPKPAKEWAPGTAAKNTSTAGKLDAQTEVILQGAFAGLQQKYAQIDAMVGKPGGPATQEEADALKKQAFDQAATTTATGMTANQRATNATTQRGQDITQGDNRATQATSIYNNAQSTAMDAAKNGAGGPAAAGGFLAMLNAAPQFQANMGGAPQPAASGMVTDDHKQRIAQLVTSGQAPADANGNRFPAAVQMAAKEAGVVPSDDGTGAQDNTMRTDTGSGQGFLGGLGAGSGTMASIPAWGPNSVGASSRTAGAALANIPQWGPNSWGASGPAAAATRAVFPNLTPEQQDAWDEQNRLWGWGK